MKEIFQNMFNKILLGGGNPSNTTEHCGDTLTIKAAMIIFKTSFLWMSTVC